MLPLAVELSSIWFSLALLFYHSHLLTFLVN